ncbi:hypothetical protein WCE34_10070 [Luteimonas sp. MJ204]|uniref:hypothetical protein n=2 Tax=unclassified Luteimonas TaxID=2629088 RepID=UPI0031BB5F12
MDMRYRSLSCVAVAAVAFMATACAGRDARDFAGRWTPVNTYADSTEAIPLHSAYLFQASPMDGTLRNLLVRWARDSGSELDYRHPSDFTLYQPVQEIRARSLADAVAQLGAAFDGQGVVLRVEGSRVVVTERSGGR